MLLVEKFFKTFIKKEISDTSKTTEVINTIVVNDRKEVDEMIQKVVKAGGKEPRHAQDHEWMYGRSFEDINRHLWEVFYIEKRTDAKGV